jgi:hypothetical protein
MKSQAPSDNSDPKLRALLRETLPPREPPPRFAEAVWQRIERAEALEQAAPVGPSWLDRLAGLILQPRAALAIAAIVMVAGALLGFLAAGDEAHQAARDIYLTAVTPYAETPNS